jgi:hypothetical protein
MKTFLRIKFRRAERFSDGAKDLRLATEASILRVYFATWRKIATRLFLAKRPAGQVGGIQGQASGSVAGDAPCAAQLRVVQLFLISPTGWVVSGLFGNSEL